MPKADIKKLKVDSSQPLTVSFKTDEVVATWWVHLVVDDKALRTWTGSTADAAADEAVIPAADLKAGRTVLWQLALFGSLQGDIDYRMEIEFRQEKKLASDKEDGTLKKKTTKGLSNSRLIEVKS